MANIVIDIASEFTGAKAFKQADSATQKLTSGVKKLAGAVGLAYGTSAVIAFGKASVRAAAADQKAQQQLALALKNVGLERDSAGAEGYIQRLQSEFGIVDDLLRPAYQSLAIATRDTAESQRLLNLSLDISAATGKDLGSVTAALSKAYLGNNTALTRLGVGISKADLKTKSFYDITNDLANTFKGSATAAASTFQGSMDKLAVASANVQEIIGTGLIDALTGLGDNNSIANLAASMEETAEYTADVIRGIGVLADKLKSLPGFSNLNVGMIPILGSYLQGLRALGQSNQIKPAPFSTPMTISGQSSKSSAASQSKLAKETLKVGKENLKLAKARAIFDLQKIQIEAALKGKISEEDRIRLLLMKAIEDENITQIEKYTKLLDDAQKNTEKLVTTLQGIKPLDDIFKNWDFLGVKEKLDTLQGYFKSFAGSAASAFNSLGAAQQAALGGYVPFVGATNASLGITSNGGSATSMPSTVGLGTSGTGNQLPAGVTINVNTGIGDPNAIAEAIDQVITEAVNRGTIRNNILNAI
jgi:hypothetical protein